MHKHAGVLAEPAATALSAASSDAASNVASLPKAWTGQCHRLTLLPVRNRQRVQRNAGRFTGSPTAWRSRPGLEKDARRKEAETCTDYGGRNTDLYPAATANRCCW